MTFRFCCALVLCHAGAVQADVFKINDASGGSALHKAVEEDSTGLYYRQYGDDDLTSYFKGPFDYGTDTVKRKVSRQIDLNTTISRQIPKVLGGVDVDAAIRQISLSPLLLWQYSSPAAADLFKHFHTQAQLRLNLLYADLRGVERGLGGSLDLLRDQSELACMEQKLARGSFNKDLIDLMVSCRDMGASPGAVFSHLGSGNGIRVYERLFNRLHLRDRKAEILDILPDWTIRPDGYHLLGPVRRIGEVFAEARAGVIDAMDDVLKKYKRDKAVDAVDLARFARPGVPFTEQTVRNLASLTEGRSWILISHLATEVAFQETADLYALAEEWLERLLVHPSVEEAYKDIVRKGVSFIRMELSSLEVKRRQLRQYGEVVGELEDTAAQAWKEVVAEERKALDLRKMEEVNAWTK